MKKENETNMDTSKILITILFGIIAALIALLQIRQELRDINRNGIRETRELEISQQDVRKIARLVLEEIIKMSSVEASPSVGGMHDNASQNV